jgi:hypothetical protein
MEDHQAIRLCYASCIVIITLQLLYKHDNISDGLVHHLHFLSLHDFVQF